MTWSPGPPDKPVISVTRTSLLYLRALGGQRKITYARKNVSPRGVNELTF
jgi:hypothetical protein